VWGKDLTRKIIVNPAEDKILKLPGELQRWILQPLTPRHLALLRKIDSPLLLSHTFDNIENKLGEIKEKFSGLFVGLAAGLGPSLENILQMLNQIDLSKIGAGISIAISGLIEAFREGKLGDLIGDSLKLGFDSLLAYAPGVFEQIGFYLIKAFETPLEYIQAGMTYALEYAIHKVINNPVLLGLLTGLNPAAAAGIQAIGDTGAPDWKQILADEKNSGLQFDLGSGIFGPSDMASDARSRIAQKTKELNGRWNALAQRYEDFASRAPHPDGAPPPPKDTGLAGLGYTAQHTALEKLGFVLRGGASESDPQRQVAHNTARTNQLIEKLTNVVQNRASFRDPLANASPI